MTDCVLGRVRIPSVIESYSVSTGQVEVSGFFESSKSAGNLELADFLRQQIVALPASRTEPVVPLVIPGVWEGFVRVESADASGVNMSLGAFRWTVRGAPVADAVEPMTETAIVGTVRANNVDQDEQTSRPVHVVPAATVQHDWGNPVLLERFTRLTATGTVEAGYATYVVIDFPDSETFGLFRGVAGWVCRPADWYVGACRVEQEVSGNWEEVVGPQSLAAKSWRMSNGIVEVHVASGADGVVSMRGWDGVWSSPRHLTLIGPGGPLTGWRAPRLARISRSSVAVTVLATDDTYDEPVSLTFTVTAGSPTVTVDVNAFAATVDAVEFAATVDYSTDDDGYVAEATAVDGWTRAMFSTEPTLESGGSPTAALTGLSSGFPGTIGLALVSDAWGADEGWTTLADVHAEWMAATSERDAIGIRR